MVFNATIEGDMPSEYHYLDFGDQLLYKYDKIDDLSTYTYFKTDSYNPSANSVIFNNSNIWVYEGMESFAISSANSSENYVYASVVETHVEKEHINNYTSLYYNFNTEEWNLDYNDEYYEYPDWAYSNVFFANYFNTYPTQLNLDLKYNFPQMNYSYSYIDNYYINNNSFSIDTDVYHEHITAYYSWTDNYNGYIDFQMNQTVDHYTTYYIDSSTGTLLRVITTSHYFETGYFYDYVPELDDYAEVLIESTSNHTTDYSLAFSNFDYTPVSDADLPMMYAISQMNELNNSNSQLYLSFVVHDSSGAVTLDLYIDETYYDTFVLGLGSNNISINSDAIAYYGYSYLHEFKFVLTDHSGFELQTYWYYYVEDYRYDTVEWQSWIEGPNYLYVSPFTDIEAHLNVYSDTAWTIEAYLDYQNGTNTFHMWWNLSGNDTITFYHWGSEEGIYTYRLEFSDASGYKFNYNITVEVGTSLSSPTIDGPWGMTSYQLGTDLWILWTLYSDSAEMNYFSLLIDGDEILSGTYENHTEEHVSINLNDYLFTEKIYNITVTTWNIFGYETKILEIYATHDEIDNNPPNIEGPTGKLTYPSNSSTVLEWTISDPNLERILFVINGDIVAELTNATNSQTTIYTFYFPIDQYAVGEYIIEIEAWDIYDNYNYFSVTIKITEDDDNNDDDNNGDDNNDDDNNGDDNNGEDQLTIPMNASWLYGLVILMTLGLTIVSSKRR